MQNIFSMISKMQPPKEGEPYETRHRVVGIVKHPDQDSFLVIKDWYGITFPGGGVEKGESFEEATIREIREETGYQNFAFCQSTEIILNHYRSHEDHNRISVNHLVVAQLANVSKGEGECKSMWIEKLDMESRLETDASKLLRKQYLANKSSLCPN